jgi:hypothetical protein
MLLLLNDTIKNDTINLDSFYRFVVDQYAGFGCPEGKIYHLRAHPHYSGFDGQGNRPPNAAG